MADVESKGISSFRPLHNHRSCHGRWNLRRAEVVGQVCHALIPARALPRDRESRSTMLATSRRSATRASRVSGRPATDVCQLHCALPGEACDEEIPAGLARNATRTVIVCGMVGVTQAMSIVLTSLAGLVAGAGHVFFGLRTIWRRSQRRRLISGARHGGWACSGGSATPAGCGFSRSSRCCFARHCRST